MRLQALDLHLEQLVGHGEIADLGLEAADLDLAGINRQRLERGVAGGQEGVAPGSTATVRPARTGTCSAGSAASSALGRVYRDVRRKLTSRTDLAGRFVEPLALIERLLTQQRADKHKLYVLHARKAECLSKGKIGKRYEFGIKVALTTINREGWWSPCKRYPATRTTGHAGADPWCGSNV